MLPEWIDWNGHMNVGFYVVAFDKATDTLCNQFGCSWEYTREKIGMTFVLEAHVTYDREVKEGDPLRITSRSSTTTPSACTSSTPCITATEGYLAATNELMLMNIDYASAPLGAVARLGHGAASTSWPPRTSPCPCRRRPAASSASRGRSKLMLVSLPYELPELVTRAPLDTHRSTVLPEWVDWNGHMNVAFYVTAFDQASGAFMRNMGLGRRYVDGKLGMTFVLETHVTYDREMSERRADALRHASCSRATPRASISSTRCSMPSRATSPRPTRRS